MATGNTRNRRRSDVVERNAQVASSVKARVPAALKALLAVTVTLFLLFGGRAASRWARTSPSFEITSVTFTGLSRATEPELTRLAALVPGQNLFQVDPDAVAQAMTAHPWVRKVAVSRHFPHALSVRVEEHVPVAMAVLADLYLLDSEGEPFKKVTPADVLNLPLVTGLGRDAYVSNPKGSLERFRDALTLLRAYEAHPSFKAERVSEIRLDKDSVAIVTGEGQDVVLGAGGVEEKLDRLARVRTELSRRGLLASAIHLDNRTRPGWVTVQLENAALGSSTAAGAKLK